MRHVWIDREFPQNHPYRVRELIGTEKITLAEFAIRDAAEMYVQRLLAQPATASERSSEARSRPEGVAAA